MADNDKASTWLNRVDILDGGLGTTLEDVFHKDISTPLWSAALIANEPDTLVEAHLAFLRAGARILSTATYQCAYETFDSAGYTRDKATTLMRKAVQLAAKAKGDFLREREEQLLTHDGEDDDHTASPSPHSDGAIKIALSLGPYGATLPSAQEFGGYYPPPYGPRTYTPAGPNTNAFEVGDDAAEKAAENALADFHFSRLRVFADDADTWALVDYIAFETVPLAREVHAIRRAVGRLQGELDGNAFTSAEKKPWWISTVWPDGQFSEESSPGGTHLRSEDVTRALVGDIASSDETTPIPTGIGINCTRIFDMGRVLPELGHALLSTLQPSRSREHIQRPWLVVYPNGGAEYNIDAKTWHPHAGNDNTAARSWAEGFVDVVQCELQERDALWGCVIVGGCCKAGPGHVRELREVASRALGLYRPLA